MGTGRSEFSEPHHHTQDSHRPFHQKVSPRSAGHHHCPLHSSFQQGPCVSSAQAHVGPLHHRLCKNLLQPNKKLPAPPQGSRLSSSHLGSTYVFVGSMPSLGLTELGGGFPVLWEAGNRTGRMRHCNPTSLQQFGKLSVTRPSLPGKVGNFRVAGREQNAGLRAWISTACPWG